MSAGYLPLKKGTKPIQCDEVSVREMIQLITNQHLAIVNLSVLFCYFTFALFLLKCC